MNIDQEKHFRPFNQTALETVSCSDLPGAIKLVSERMKYPTVGECIGAGRWVARCVSLRMCMCVRVYLRFFNHSAFLFYFIIFFITNRIFFNNL